MLRPCRTSPLVSPRMLLFAPGDNPRESRRLAQRASRVRLSSPRRRKSDEDNLVRRDDGAPGSVEDAKIAPRPKIAHTLATPQAQVRPARGDLDGPVAAIEQTDRNGAVAEAF